MTEAVKRTYSSTLRAEQARATRLAIVAAAAELFARDGYGATTVDAIAEAAGVSRKTVFTSVGGKVEALKLARDWAIVGDDEPVPMLERPWIKDAMQQRDARRVLVLYAENYVISATRVAPIHHVIESAKGIDEDVRALSDEGWEQRRFGMAMFAKRLAALGALPDGMTVDEAADIAWYFNDPETYYKFVISRGWPVHRFQSWLAESMQALLLRKGYKPAK